MKDFPSVDIQKVDIGIALSHFDLSAQEKGMAVQFLFADPGISVPESIHYMVSCKVT